VPDQVVQDLALPSAVVSGTNLFTSRISYDFNQNLRVGTLLTHGDPEAVRDNTFTGIDAVWRTSKFLGDKNLQFGAWTATTKVTLVLAVRLVGASLRITPMTFWIALPA
jgi:hypothetical protein